MYSPPPPGNPQPNWTPAPTLPPPPALKSTNDAALRRGSWVMGIGGVVALLAFLVLPYVSILVSITGVQAAQDAGALWLVPVAGAVMAIVAARVVFNRTGTPTKPKGGAVLALIGSILGAGVLLLLLVGTSNTELGNLSGALGSGFWLSLLGMGAGFVGAIMVMRA